MPEQYQSQIVGPSDTFDVTVASPETIYAPSLSPSPPQSIFSPEQRELKRQTDQARKASKQRLRRERSSSSSFDMSHTNAPDMIPRSINGNTFTSSMPSMSLPTEPLMPLPSQPYMTGSPVPMPLTSSPAPMSSSESPELYGSQFPMLSNDFGAGSYLMPFSSATSEPSVPSYAAPRPHSLSAGAHDQPYFYRSPPLMAQESSDTIRVVHSRPKPQCWDHGCNGRQFSTFSNLLRHQREKSGVASKPTCPKCGAEFTRTTARNGHMAHEKCKQRRNS
ncbi:MAG: hypothetical protein M1818_001477 [Claussenomyces sp. TS43310]|nr:MAG: hypothetical protein M1818_001477 [Claussenomyces sp. TS43310]